MPFLDVLVHTAVPMRTSNTGEWVEGQHVKSSVAGTPFTCCLFLPQGGASTSNGRTRQVKEPTLLYDPLDTAGADVALTVEDELLITAPELNVAQGLAADAQVRWTVAGAPQPFGRPGLDPIGFQVTLRRIDE